MFLTAGLFFPESEAIKDPSWDLIMSNIWPRACHIFSTLTFWEAQISCPVHSLKKPELSTFLLCNSIYFSIAWHFLYNFLSSSRYLIRIPWNILTMYHMLHFASHQKLHVSFSYKQWNLVRRSHKNNFCNHLWSFNIM